MTNRLSPDKGRGLFISRDNLNRLSILSGKGSANEVSGDERGNLRFPLASEKAAINPLEQPVPEGASDIR